MSIQILFLFFATFTLFLIIEGGEFHSDSPVKLRPRERLTTCQQTQGRSGTRLSPGAVLSPKVWALHPYCSGLLGHSCSSRPRGRVKRVWVCGEVPMSAGACWGYKVSDSLELELQGVVNHLTWVLEIKFWSLESNSIISLLSQLSWPFSHFSIKFLGACLFSVCFVIDLLSSLSVLSIY